MEVIGVLTTVKTLSQGSVIIAVLDPLVVVSVEKQLDTVARLVIQAVQCSVTVETTKKNFQNL